MKTRIPSTIWKASLPLFAACLVLGTTTGCSKKSSDPEPIVVQAAPRYLYVASGVCYSGGGNTSFTNATASNYVFRVNLSNSNQEVLADYNASPAQAGDSPVGLASADANHLYVLVENTSTAGARRIEKLEKTFNGPRSLFSNNTTALSAQVRNLLLLKNGDLLISKSTAIEKITASNVRITSGANPFINAPSAPCATSTTLISKTVSLNNQFVAFLHAAASQNRFGFVKPQGYAVAGDCTVAQAAPNVNAYPVAMAYDSANSKLLVAYAGNATSTDLNSIYSYNITETASSVTVGTANKIYDSSGYPSTYPYLLYGISEMVLDPVDQKLYVATAINTSTTIANYAIERFSYDPTQIGSNNPGVLTRDSSSPFFNFNGETKCISQMMIDN